MKITIPNFIRWYPFMSLLLSLLFISFFTFLYYYYKVNSEFSVTVTGLQHLGSDYRIDGFYIEKNYFRNAGEAGEDGVICCLTLRKKWPSRLTVDVRWVVNHVIKSAGGAPPNQEEITATYRAQVPVETYAHARRLFVHFFPEGRVRIEARPDLTEDPHPIRPSEENAFEKVTTGSAIKSIFTPEELANLEKDRTKYGNWK